MKKNVLFIFVILFITQTTKAQFYETHPHFISFTGGAGNASFHDVKFPGYYGKFEGAFFFNYLFGAGLQVNHGYYKPFENIFANERINAPRIPYNKTTATLDHYIIENYTANAYFVAMPVWWFSFMACGGVGFQRTLTPQGSILYQEIHPYQHYGSPTQSSTIDVVRETRRSIVFHVGLRTNLMVTDRFGFTFNTDYFFAKNKKYPNENLHEVTGTAGIIIKLHEMFY